MKAYQGMAVPVLTCIEKIISWMLISNAEQVCNPNA